MKVRILPITDPALPGKEPTAAIVVDQCRAKVV
jgi:hypothetical protein